MDSASMDFSFQDPNLEFLEELYKRFKDDPLQVEPQWRCYFEEIEAPVSKTSQVGVRDEKTSGQSQCQICNLIHAYRNFGHLSAKIDPIGRIKREENEQLKIESHGFTSRDLAKKFSTCGLLNKKQATLEEIVKILKKIYCTEIGIEFPDNMTLEMKQWVQEKMEPALFERHLSIEQKHTLLEHLNKSELFESFLQTKYPGQKRFSLEGAESLIPCLEAIIETSAQKGGKDFYIGMAHRGRLNVLSNILKKSHVLIFTEFDENFIPDSFEGSGDVKYHKGFYSESLKIRDYVVNISLTPNPSHLEAVDSVVEGQVKSKQVLLDDPKSIDQVIPILIHGDAAISGQGVVYETMQFSKLEGYQAGGTIHIVINNQIGFTTVPDDSRSTLYCTDLAKAFEAPVFHVNAEDPEGCFIVGLLAAEFRQKFHRDIFIDLNCYRKYGHNESDEPFFTQPLEYKIIRQKRPIREIYRDQLIEQGLLEKAMAERLEEQFKKGLQEALLETKNQLETKGSFKKREAILPGKEIENPFQFVDTAVSLQELEEIAQKISTIPEGFSVHPKLDHLLKERSMMGKSGPGSKPLDWGMAETLAYGSLLYEGKSVRLSGQDSQRGTFSHRHGVLIDQSKERAYFPLQHLKKGQGRFDLINSPLSEYAALGFEYGYSLVQTGSLVIWEAQFGDFSNGGQVIIDQFIATGEQKWGQKSGLTLFLPHGYEGQGPEHSSGRMERFLTLAGHHNMCITDPTTPAQLFHLLRRQALSTFHKPLIVFTPKSLLRHPDCTSSLMDLTQGSFQEILDDPILPKKAEKVVLCTGRIYYDLFQMRQKTKNDDLAIIRIEQLYPLHLDKLKAILKNYPSANQFFWVQEEPKNMGAWGYITAYLSELFPDKKLSYVGRERSASPAAGSYALHKKEHADIMEFLFAKTKPSIFDIAAGN